MYISEQRIRLLFEHDDVITTPFNLVSARSNRQGALQNILLPDRLQFAKAKTYLMFAEKRSKLTYVEP